jgi:thioredoxin reductase (NADPH)
MSRYLVERIQATSNVEVCLQTEVIAAHGSDHLEAVTFRDHKTGQDETHQAIALFIFIGARPCTEWLEGVIRMDERGFILAGPQLLEDGRTQKDWPLERSPYLLEASIPGVFVVGDVRSRSVKRVASAVARIDRRQFVHQYLAKVSN